ncbi:MAG: hypothetical protein P8R42_24140 [Candidatus Binatia bacterium]|nr:hypothetical protein [Candidatus Binatia bacterium]
MKNRMLAILVGLVAVLTWVEARAQESVALSTPPPVSGRRLSDPASILPADVLARAELVRGNVDLIRRYMGKPRSSVPLLEVEGAAPREVYSQALNLERRAHQLAFEQVRVVRPDTVPLQQDARPADVYAVVDSALASILLVKEELGIDDPVAEQKLPDSTEPSAVFNGVVAAGTEVDQLTRQQTSPRDVYRLVTESVHYGSALLASLPGGPRTPAEPAFEPNKTPADVYTRMRRCFDLVRGIAEQKGQKTLRFESAPTSLALVTPSDVSDLAALLGEELVHLHGQFPGVSVPPRAYDPGWRFPAHVYQRAGLLELILEQIAAVTNAREQASPAAGDG